MDVKEPNESYEIQEYMLNKKFEVPLTSYNEENPIYQEEIQIGSEVEILKKSLHQYKIQNEYLNDANDKLTQVNRRLREDLEEVNVHYQELIIVTNEASKRKKNAQSQIEDLTKRNEELLNKFQELEVEQVRLLKISQALDGLTMMVEAVFQI